MAHRPILFKRRFFLRLSSDMHDMQDNILAREIIFEKIRASLSSDCRKKILKSATFQTLSRILLFKGQN